MNRFSDAPKPREKPRQGRALEIMAPTWSSGFQLALELAKQLQGSTTGSRVLLWGATCARCVLGFCLPLPVVFQAHWMHSARSCGLLPRLLSHGW